ncbi:MAG: TetR family transcriptional regulator, partial [Pseudonocardiales bacterium]
MTVARRPPSARQEELLERAYRYVLAHGLAELSLRPLAAAIESSPRVLLFLFGSKEGLVRALLARARNDELALIDQTRQVGRHDDLTTVIRTTWRWLAAYAHRPLLNLWAEAYARSLVEPEGPWAHFAEQAVADWL